MSMFEVVLNVQGNSPMLSLRGCRMGALAMSVREPGS